MTKNANSFLTEQKINKKCKLHDKNVFFHKNCNGGGSCMGST